jgi:alginate O-acetyltransferase complex protein AlgI
MDIISLEFATLTVVSVFVFYLIPQKYRIIYLAILSCAFITSFNYLLLPYVLIYSLFNYYIGKKLPESNNKKALYRLGLILNVSQLVVLRYATFAIDPFFQFFNSSIQISKLAEIIVPIGISYFTLQGIGYIINVKMGWEKPETRFPDFLLYVTFFPKFISGPIERSTHFLPQLKKKHVFSEQNFVEGLRIALFGFLKKVAIANQLAPFITGTFNHLDSVDGSMLWILVILLPIYLYFDFSGYIDIAIGFARMFGINLLPNFNRPFFAENMTNFWKRFHISLSSWFGDYIFRQTVLKRRKWGVYASMYAVFITWVLFGIWHGAGWNFMLLGFLQAIAINWEFFTRKWRFKLFSRMNKFFRTWIGRVCTYIFYSISLVFFFSPDIQSTFTLFSNLFSIGESVGYGIFREIPLSAFILIFMFFLSELIQEDFAAYSDRLFFLWSANNTWNRLFRWTIYSFILAILFVLGSQITPFIYAHF